MDHEALRIADVGEVTPQLEAFDECSSGLAPTPQAEAEDRARSEGQVLFDARCFCGTLQPGVRDPGNLIASPQPTSDRQRVLAVLTHAQRERLEPLHHQ